MENGYVIAFVRNHNGTHFIKHLKSEEGRGATHPSNHKAFCIFSSFFVTIIRMIKYGCYTFVLYFLSIVLSSNGIKDIDISSIGLLNIECTVVLFFSPLEKNVTLHIMSTYVSQESHLILTTQNVLESLRAILIFREF